MEGGGGGGGGAGGGGGGFPYGNPITNLHLLRPRPPFTAIDRFLWGQQSHLPPQQNFMFPHFNFQSSTSAGPIINGHAGGLAVLPWPCVQESSALMDGTLNWTSPPESNPEFAPNGEMKLDQKILKPNGKKENAGSSMPLIKGQWTEDEDRKLVRLVKHYGVKKWAQIAEKMVGRAGKQCRERWQNHLRPNIKKDSWSEEEERLLVEAHMQVGNRWAEIAKRIPGRTENSIKNHWNATKRRQNSRRKCKKPEGGAKLIQSTVLQDYIRNAFPKEDSSSSSPAAATTPQNSTLSDPTHYHLLYPELSHSTSDDSASYLTQQTHDEEMNFMQNLFGSNTGGSLVDSGKANASAEVVVKPSVYGNPLGFSGPGVADKQLLPAGNMGHGLLSSSIAEQKISRNNYQEDQTQNAHSHSDFLSHLFDGATALTSGDSFPNNANIDQMLDQESSSVAKEMDLMEMVANVQASRGSSSNRFVF